jgi:CubicO group peptidase (beta-lactamase class C family)
MGKIKFILVFIIVSNVANGQISERIDSLALEHASKGFNGNVLYSKNDSIIFTGNYGFSNLKTKEPLNDHSIFDLASCTKQFTAVAIIQLVEKGMLSYDDRVTDIIKTFPYDKITVEHLLRHQSGLPKFQRILGDKKIWNPKIKATNKDLLHILSELKIELQFHPGTQYQYSNTGYVVLASIVEHLAQQTYEEYIQENIFKPAGMLSSKVQNRNEYLPRGTNMSLGYTYNKRKRKNTKVEKDKNHKHIHWMNNIIGGRGIYSSVLDLEKWKQALRYNKLISEKSKLRMFSVDTISTKYGYGFAIYDAPSKGKWVYHNGSWSGYKTMTLYLPESNEFLVILSNNRYEETYRMFEEGFYNLIQ